jgi:hypothetical protein
MGLQRRGAHSYADSQSDLREELLDYSVRNSYPAAHFADAACGCGGRLFRLLVDDTVGAALRRCAACGAEHPIGDSGEYLDEASLDECECPCGNDSFEVTVGVALYRDSDAVRWIYLGCRCPRCSLAACYADWKNEHDDYRELLRLV